MSDGREELLRQDAEARTRAHLLFDRPLVVEAGAGTGKTALLTARIVAWCLGPGWELHGSAGQHPEVARRVIERVVAITFTEAAAAEMAERVGGALGDLAGGDTPPGLQLELVAVHGEELGRRCEALADEMHRLPAMTIHSFCHRLLRAFPLEAGVHPDFAVDADGSRVEAVVEDATLQALREADGAALSDWETMAAAGVSLPRVAAAAAALTAAGITASDLGRDPLGAGELAALVEEISQALAALLGVEDGCLADGTPVSVHTMSALRDLWERLGSPRRETPDGLVAAASVIDERAAKRLGAWSKGTFTATDRKALGGRTAWFEPAAGRLAVTLAGVTGLRPRELTAARDVLGALLAKVAGRLAAEGIVTYAELLRGAQRLLASSRRLRSEIRRGIDQLLVDEFQDTDQVQCDIVARLALEGGPDERPGLFIVGDPKQSIYGWRGADLAAYDAFKAQVLAEGGVVRPLVRNFRSVAPILAEVERVVAPVMAERVGVQPPFQPLEPTGERATGSGFAVGEWTPVEHWLAWPEDPESGLANAEVKKGEATAAEAVMVAADIRRLHDEEEVPWKDVGILLRTTTEQEAVLERLREAGVPFEVARERDYFRQREVVEAAALVRAVLEPSDHLALLTVLRSDAVGTPDAALTPVFDAGLPALMADLPGPTDQAMDAVDRCLERALAATPTDLPGAGALPDWPVAVRAAVQTVLDLRLSLRRDPPDIFVERLRTLWLTEVTSSARYLGRFRRARLERFFAQLEGALATADGSLAPVARFLRRAVEEAREPEVPMTPETLSDAVHVMTVHGAKGLDFEHVYVLQIHRGDGRPARRSDATVLRDPGGLSYQLFGWATPRFAAAEDEQRQRECAERVRLLYVAMTRAKRRLVLSGRWRSDGALVEAAAATSFADLAAHRLRPEGLIQRLVRGTGRILEDPETVQWVLPAAMAQVAGKGAATAPPPPADVGRVLADAARLEALRAAAARRQGAELAATVTRLVEHDVTSLEDGETGTTATVRSSARAIGSVIHLLLETLDLNDDLAAQVRARGEELRARLAAAVSVRDRDAACRRLDEELARLAGGACLARLAEVAGSVAARELPLLLPPMGEEVVGFVTGTADLVYEENGAPVVADYKTDRVSDDEGLAELVARYRPQLAWYARALQEALELPAPPGAELWFLHADRIVRL